MILFVIYFAILICLGNLLYKWAKVYKEDKNLEEKIEQKFNLEHGIVKLSEKFEKRAILREHLNKMAHKGYGKIVAPKQTASYLNCNSSKVVLLRKE